jgi:hygromycin-B 7''-O-kinase
LRDRATYGPLLTDAAFWRPVVEAIAIQSGLPVPDRLEPGYPGSCAVFIADSAWVVKIFPPFFAADHGREVEAYRLLGDRLNPNLPRLLAAGTLAGRPNLNYFVLDYRAGVALRDAASRLGAADRPAMAAVLGRLIRLTHDTPLLDSRLLDPAPDRWSAFVRERVHTCLDKLAARETIAPGLLLESAELLRSMAGELAADRPLVLVNGDLTEDHLLLQEADGHWRVSALIDWGDCMIAPAEYEWVALWFGLCGRQQALFSAVLEAAYPEVRPNRRFRQRMLAYTLIHPFGPLIVADLLKATRGDPLKNAAALQEFLWPRTLADRP